VPPSGLELSDMLVRRLSRNQADRADGLLGWDIQLASKLIALGLLLLLAGCQKVQPVASVSLPVASVRVRSIELEPHVAFENVVGTVRPKLQSVIEAKVSGQIEKMLVVPGQQVPKKRHHCEHVVGKSGSVGVVLLDPEIRFVIKQAVEHVRCIAHVGVNDLGMKWGEAIRDMGVKKHARLGPVSKVDLASLLAHTSLRESAGHRTTQSVPDPRSPLAAADAAR
jgi:hypothetical protein